MESGEKILSIIQGWSNIWKRCGVLLVNPYLNVKLIKMKIEQNH